MHLQERVVGVCLSRQQTFEAQSIGLLGQLQDRRLGVGDNVIITFRLAQLDQFDTVCEFGFEGPVVGYGVVQASPLTHGGLGALGVIPQRRVFGKRVKFLQALQRRVPVKGASSAGPWTA